MEFIQKFKNFLLLQKPTPSPATVKNYVADVRHFISWCESFLSRDFNPNDVTLPLINQFKEHKTREYSVRSIERHISSLKKFFYALKLQGVVSRSPFDAIPQAASVSQDPWHLKEFKDFLYVYNASRLTIKNYIIDVKQFLQWAEEVTGAKEAAHVSGKNVFTFISNSLLEEYKLRLYETNTFSASSINRKLSSLRKYFTWAGHQGFISLQIAIPDNLMSTSKIDSTQEESVPNIDINPNITTSTPPQPHENKQVIAAYSKFPPFRLMQKIGKGIDLALEAAVVAPLTKVIIFSHKQIWKLQGKKLFAKEIQSNIRIPQPVFRPYITNFKKALYAPHALATQNFPWYRKAIHHAQYTRPGWYRKYHSYALAHYFNWAILMVFCTAIGFGMYNSFIAKPESQPSLAASAPPRILSFQGRLTDNNDVAITASTSLQFAIYTTDTGGTALWQETDSVTPDKNGVFSVLLGKGTAIPQSLFANNQNLYLGITVGTTPELTPRQQLATVAYAENSDTLQGMPPITQSGAGNTNVILALNSSGNLTVGASTTFQSTSGSFTLAGNTVALTTNSGSNSNITLTPDGTGVIDLQKPLVNTTTNGNFASAPGAVEIDDLLAVLASSAASAVTVNQTGTGALISASTSGAPIFTVGNAGDITSANYAISGGLIYTNGSGLFLQTGAGGIGQCLTSSGGGAPSWGSCGGGTNYWSLDNTQGTLAPINSTLDVFFGGTSTSSANFAFINNASGTPTASISGNLTLNSAGVIQATNNQPLTIGGNSTGNIILSPLNGLGNVTIAGLSSGVVKSTNGVLGISTVNLASEVSGILPLANGGTNNNLTADNGGVVYSDASKLQILAHAATAGACLVSGGAGAPTWGNCTSGGGNNWWNMNLGTIFPVNTTLDFVLGGTGTDSAKFAVINMASGTPTASIAGNITLNSAGVIQTTNNQPLTLGGNSTGNIILAPGNGTGNIVLNGTVNSNLLPSVTNTYDLGSSSLQWNNLFVNNIISTGSLSGFFQRTLGVISPANSSDDIAVGGTSTSSAKFQVFGTTGNATTSGTFTFTGAGSLIQTTSNQPLTIGGNTTGSIILSPNNGTGILTLNGNLNLNGKAVSNIVPATNDTYDLGASNLQWNNLYVNSIFQSGRPLIAAWQRNLGVIAPLNTSDDLAIGGTATNSATFQIFGNTGNATTSGTLTFNTAGSIQTTNNQTLTLGGNSTGGIILSPNNGTGTVTITGLGTGVVHSTGGVLSTSTVVLTSEVSGILPIANGGTNTNSIGSSGTVAYSNGTNYAFTGVGSSGDCLVSNGSGAPGWGSCSLAAGASNYWTQDNGNGILYPNNPTLDVLFGGNSTASAKFAFINNAGGTPTASIAGNLTLNSAGIIQTTSNQPLTIGGNSTGNIILSPNNGTGAVTVNGTKLLTTASSFDLLNTTATTINFGGGANAINIGSGIATTTVNNDLTVTGVLTANNTADLNGDVALGNATSDTITATGRFGSSLVPTTTDTYDLGASSLEWNNLYVRNIISAGNIAGFFQRNLGVIAPIYNSDDLAVGGPATGSAKFQIFGTTGNATTAGTLTFDGTGSLIQTTKNQGLTIGGNTTGNIILSPLNGSGTVTVNGNKLVTTVSSFDLLNTTATTINFGGAADINLSTAGKTTTVNGALTSTGVFTANNTATLNGNVTLGANNTNTVTVNGVFNSSLIPAATDTYDLGSTNFEWNNLYIKNIISNGTISGFWQRILRVIAPTDITDDFAIGGNSTASAKFQIFGTTGNATTTGTLTFDGTGSLIQTTKNQGLTIGGDTTGNIVLSPLNGNGSVTINGNKLVTTASSFDLLNTTATTINFGSSATTLNIANNALNTTINIGGTSGTTTVNNGLTVTGAFTANNDVTLGNSSSNTINPVGVFSGSLIPQSSTVNLGSSTNYFGSAFITNLFSAANSLYQGFFQRFSGVLSPFNITDDFAIGGTSTASAKFQIFGNTGNATTTGTLTFNTAGSIQTTNNLPLVLGGNSTGNIVLSPNNGTGAVTVNGKVNSSLIPTATNTYDLGSNSLQWNTVYANSVIVNGQPLSQEWQRNLGVLSPLNITDDLALGGTATGAATFQVFGITGNATTSGNLTFNTAGSIQTTNNQGLTLGGNTTGNIILSPLNGSGTVTINGNKLITTASSFDLLNTTATTINFGGAATTANLVTSATNLHLDDGTGSTSISIGGGAGTTIVNNALTATGTFTANNAANLNGDVNLGNATSDTITANGEFGSGLFPNTKDLYDVGSLSLEWNNLYAKNIFQNGQPVIAAWQRNLGVISPLNITDDLALGGTATSTAKFQVFGTTGNATTSGTLTFAGTSSTNLIAVRNMAGLTIGDAQTGPIIFSGGNVGIGTTNPTAPLQIGIDSSSTPDLLIGTTGSTGTNYISVSGGRGMFGYNSSNGNLALSAGNAHGVDIFVNGSNGTFLSGTDAEHITSPGFIGIGTGTSSSLIGNAQLVVNQTNTSGLGDILTGSASGTTKFIVTNSGIVEGSSFQDLDNTSYLLDPASTNISQLVAGTVGIGTLTPLNLSGLDIEKNAQGNAALVVANLNTAGDLITASNSGGTKFTVANNGTFSKTGYTTSGGVLWGNASGVIGQTAAGNLGECLTSTAGGAPVWAACATGASGTNFWTMSNGALYPVNSTFDEFIGGTSTASAKFAVLNMASGTPVASVSSGLNGTAIFLSADGSLQTATENTLTIGGNRTGNITLSPQNGNGSVTVNGVAVDTTASVFNLLATPSNLTFGSAATSLTIGAGTGSTTFRNPTLDDSAGTATLFGTPTSITFGGAATTLNIGNASGTTAVQGAFNVNGNTTLGTNTSNTVTINGVINQSILPQSSSINLGDSSHYWGTVYANNFIAPITGGTSGFWSMTNNLIFPANTFYDLAIGGTATGSATPWQVFSTTLGVNTAGTATSSGGLSFRGTTPGSNTDIAMLNGSVLRVRTSVGGDEGLNTQLQLDNNGDLTLSGQNINTTNGTVSLFNTTATTVNFAGNADVNIGKAAGATLLRGNLTLGSSNTNTIFLNGKFSTSLLPTSNTIDIGGSTNYFGSAYLTNLYIAGNYSGFWKRFNQVISPFDNANDFAIGGDATSSAKFQVFATSFTNGGSTMVGNTVPAGTASMSGDLTFRGSSTGNVNVRILNGNNLNFYTSEGGDSDLGQIGGNNYSPALSIINRNIGTFPYNFNNQAYVGIGTSTTYGSPLTVQAADGTGGIHIMGQSSADVGLYMSAPYTSYSYIGGNSLLDAESDQTIAKMPDASLIGFEAGDIAFFTDEGLTPGSEYKASTRMVIDRLGKTIIGAGGDIYNGHGFTENNAQLVVNQTNNSGLGDIFSASTSGIPKFTIANDGTIKNSLIPNLTDTYNLGSDPTLGGKEWDTLYVRQIVTPATGGIAGFWQLSNGGVLAPSNTTNDLVIGGNSTASAHFQVFGSGSGVGTIAAKLNDPMINNNAGALTASTKIINIASADHSYMTLDNRDLTIGGHKNMQSSITNVQKVYIYDTSKDSDGGRWTNDDKAQASSWYNEAATDASNCVVGTNTRCGQQAFPKKAIIVVTSNQTGSLYIFDAKDNSLWMEFDKGATTNENMVGPITSDPGSSVAALNGKIYFATGGLSGTAGALYEMDFTQDISYKFNDTGFYKGANTIANRNSLDSYTFYPGAYGPLSPAGFANRFIDVDVKVVANHTYIAGATRSGVVLYDESTQTLKGTFDTIGIASNVAMTSTGDLYATVCIDGSNPCTHYVLKALHELQNVSFGTNKTFDDVYGYNSATNYGASQLDNNTFNNIVFTPGPSATTSANWTTPIANGMVVTQGTSTADGVSNTIYLGATGSNGSLAVIQENQATPAAGMIKYYNGNYITDDMAGDIRGMWPFNETNGNLIDESVKGNVLVASSSGVTYSASGVRGTALTFNGTSGYLYCGDATCGGVTNLGIGGTPKTITIGAWVKTSASGARQVIMSKFNSGVAGSYLLSVESTGQVLFSLNGLSPISNSIRTVNDGNWHHVVGTYDGTYMKVYIDGQLDNEQAKSGAFLTTSTQFMIGADLVGGYAANWFNGSIDEPFISASTYTGGEIAHMYQVGYRALQNHSSKTIRGVVTGSDSNQKLINSNSNVSAIAANLQNSQLYIGTTGGGVSVIGLDSDTLTDMYSSNINTTGDVGTAWSASANNNIIQSIAAGQSYGNGTALTIGTNNVTLVQGNVWMETQDSSFKDFMASSYNPFGSNLTQSNLNVDTVLRVTNQLSTSLTNDAFISSTSSAKFADAFRVDSDGNLLSRSLVNSSTAMQFKDANSNIYLNINTIGGVMDTAINIRQPGSGDILIASNSASTEFQITNAGVIRGRSFQDLDNTSYFLDPAASSTSLTVAGNIGIATTNPIAKLQIDPGGIGEGTLLADSIVPVQGMEDVAAGITPTVSGGNLINGGPTSRGNGYWQATATGQTMTLDLTASTEVDYITFGTNWRTDTRYIPNGYTIAYSTDNITYTTLTTVTSNTDVSQSIRTGGINARYWRITVNAFQSGQTYSQIQGLQLMSYWFPAMDGEGSQLWGLNDNISNTNMFSRISGNVGIGTTTPSDKLEVNGAGRFSGATRIGSGVDQGYYGDGTNLALRGFNQTNSALYIQSYNGATTPMWVGLSGTNAGNVGIGTSGPGALLDVEGSGGSTIQVKNNGRFWSDSTSGGMWVDNAQSMFMGIASSSQVGFWNNGSWRLVTDSGGDTSIGTTTTNFALTVVNNNAGACVGAGCFTAVFENANTGANTNGIDVQLGVADGSRGTGQYFISFSGGTNLGSIPVEGKIQANGANAVAYATSGADYGEYFYMADPTATPSAGDLVQVYPNIHQSVVKAASPSARVVGVVSDSTGFIGNDVVCLDGEEPHACDSRYRASNVVVGLVGQVKTHISNINGEIQNGDDVVATAIPGLGAKQLEAGDTVGRAVQSTSELTSGQYSNANCPVDQQGLKDPSGNPIKCGTIMVFVHPGYNDPNTMLTSTGDYVMKDATPSADFTVPHYYTLSDALGNSVNRMGTFLELAVANIRAGAVNTQQLFTNSLAIATTNVTIAGQSLHDYILSVVQSAGLTGGQVAQTPSVKTNVISPLSGGNIALRLTNSGIEIAKDASGSAVASIDNNGNATFSGQINAQNLAVNSDATVSGTLHAHRIEADEIAGLSAAVGTLSAQNITNVTNIYFATASAGTVASNNITGFSGISSSNSGALTPFMGYANIASFSGFLSYVPNLNADTAMFGQGLVSMGQTSLADTTITGQLAIGSQLILSDNAVNVLGGTFQIQSLAQGDVSFEGGLVAIDTNGNLTVNGNAVFANNLAANVITSLGNDRDLTLRLGDNSTATGSALATANLSVKNASGSSVFNIDQLGNVIASGAANIAKLNINAVQSALAVSDTEVVATGSAGTAAVKAHQTEVTIDNSLVTSKSLIYITPVGQTNYTPYLLRQVDHKSFTVGIPVQQYVDTTFNWLIVN